MTDWTTASVLRAQVQRRWDQGQLLAERAAPQGLFPLRLTLRGPSSTELSTHFDAVRTWAAELAAGAQAGYRLAMREVRHRVIGQNSVPAEAWIDTCDEALALIGRTADAGTFDALLHATRRAEPSLLPWLQRQPLRALALAHEWPRLLALVGWVRAHPRPGVYLRQVDVPGLHSKFIETERRVIGELLDLALPADAIDLTVSGGEAFARRYGFRDKPVRVRFRLLAPGVLAWADRGDGDYTVGAGTFAALRPAVRDVFVTENETNFLAFPAVDASLVVFGAGYGFDALGTAEWLRACRLHYWGDIDTHGFAILDQLRAHHPHARSLLMDRDTLLAHRSHWTLEPKPVSRDLPRLTADERAVYDELRFRRLDAGAVRLEQERIDFGRVRDAAESVKARG